MFEGHHPFVNVNASQGELRAELLDSTGKALATSKAVAGDTTKQRTEWLDQIDLAKWAGQRVRFRFQLSNGQLYSFWITGDAGGASHGYVGAGGPDFPGVRDVISSNPRYGLTFSADAAPRIMVQIESVEGVKNVDAIAAVDGVYMLFVGPEVLRHDLEHHPDWNLTDFDACLPVVVKASRQYGKAAGIL